MNYYQSQAKQLTDLMLSAKDNIANKPNMAVIKVIYKRLLTTELAPIAAEIVGKMQMNVSENAMAEAREEIIECAETMVDVLAEMFCQIRDFMSPADARIFILASSHQFSLEMA